MKKYTIILTLVIAGIFLLTGSACAVDRTPVSPDWSLFALNLMAIECQNLSDFSNEAAQGNLNGFDMVKAELQVGISNFDFLVGSFVPEYIADFKTAQQSFTASAESALKTAAVCQDIRYKTYQKMASVNGVLDPNPIINDFQQCSDAGYFISGGTCFMGGNLVFDARGYLVGLYNADCFDTISYYQGTCWYCEYGNNQNGCNDSTGY